MNLFSHVLLHAKCTFNQQKYLILENSSHFRLFSAVLPLYVGG